jgi:hypothetical protein
LTCVGLPLPSDFSFDGWVRQQYRRRYPGPRRTTDRAIGGGMRDMECTEASRCGST